MRALVFIMIALLGAEASAQVSGQNLFVPNVYKNRRQTNLFSAVAWSDRKEAGLNYTNLDTPNYLGGATSSEDKSNLYSPYAFYKIDNNWNVEAEYLRQDTKTTYSPPSLTSKTALNLYLASVGYEFTDIPVALGLTVLGFDYNLTSDQSSGTSTLKSTGAALGAGYRLPSDIYLGAGLTVFKTTTAFTGTASSDHTTNSYFVGAGKVYGDKKKPDATTEVVLNFNNDLSTQNQNLAARGLLNIQAMQVYGEVDYGISQGTKAGSNYAVTGGVDYEYASFFVGPQVTYSMTKTTDGTISDDSETNWSVLAGYRCPTLEAYVGYGKDQSKSIFDVASTNTSMDSKQVFAGASYHF